MHIAACPTDARILQYLAQLSSVDFQIKTAFGHEHASPWPLTRAR